MDIDARVDIDEQLAAWRRSCSKLRHGGVTPPTFEEWLAICDLIREREVAQLERMLA